MKIEFKVTFQFSKLFSYLYGKILIRIWLKVLEQIDRQRA